MESQGLARRIRSREDRRANAVELTAKGRRALTRAERLMEECESNFVGVLDRAERQQLTSMLERLLSANLRE
jgi:DNA-binding MarR family transcriptional regulator